MLSTFLRIFSEPKRLSELKSREDLTEAEGKEEFELSRRDLLAKGLAFTAAGIIGLKVAASLQSIEARIENSRMLRNPNRISDEDFHNDVLQIVQDLAPSIPFFANALESIKTKGYQFKIHRARTDAVVATQHKDQNATTERISNEVYFNWQNILAEAERKERSRGRSFLAILSRELVHVMLDDIHDEDTEYKQLRGVSSSIFNFAKRDKTKTWSIAEQYFINEAIKEVLSNLVSNSIWEAKPNQSLESILKSETIISESRLSELMKRTIQSKIEAFAKRYEESALEPRIKDTLKTNLALIEQRILNHSSYIYQQTTASFDSLINGNSRNSEATYAHIPKV